MKWQHLYIPNLNNIFVVPDELSKYELFDRIVIVRGGYPVKFINQMTYLHRKNK